MTNKRYNEIPKRQKCVNKEEPYIGGSIDIYDDEKNKHQQQINKETDDTFDLHQSEINALDSQNYESYTATDQASVVTDILPATGSKDTVYRVGKWDGVQYNTTKYSEYAWDANNNEYKLLDVKEVGIDDTIRTGSHNLIESGSVANITDNISFEDTENLIDFYPVLKNAEGITHENDEWYGTLIKFWSKQVLVDIPIRAYHLSFLARCEDNASTSGNGLQVKAVYTDDSTTTISVLNSTNTWTRHSAVLNNAKKISKIVFDYGSGSNNIVHIKELQLRKGATLLPYISPKTVVDYNARLQSNKKVFDISLFNNTTYASLSAALAAIPEEIKIPGIDIKYVDTNTHKYKRWSLLTDTWSTSESDWRGIDTTVKQGSKNLIESGGVEERFNGVLFYNSALDFSISDIYRNIILSVLSGEIFTKNFNSKTTPKIITSPFNFAVSDNNGNSCLVVTNGELFTKNFKSINTPKISDFYPVSVNSDLGFADEQGNIALYITRDGDIITKKFSTKVDKNWKDKGILFLGDSITDHGYYVAQVKKELGCKAYNRGISGSRIQKTSSRTDSFVERILLPANNTENAKTYGMPDNDHIDAIVIFGGTNDWLHSVEDLRLGSFTGAMDNISFYGSLKTLCSHFRTNYPKKPIIFCTMLPSYLNNSGAQDYMINNDGSLTQKVATKADGNHTRDEYNEAIKKVAEVYGCYVIDMHKLSGLCGMDADQRSIYYLNGDGVHPNENSGKIVGSYISKYISENIYSFTF